VTDKMDATKQSFFDLFTRSPVHLLTRASHNDSDEEESLTNDDFYVKGFLKKECSAFVPDSEKMKQRCGCGRLKTDHEEGIETSLGETWSSEKHTSKRPTDSYGLLSFSEEDQDSGISTKYIRISDSTSIEMVWSLLTKSWDLKLPRLVLSVLGGDDSEKLNSPIKHALEEGIAKIIGAMKVWLLTGATDVALTRIISSSLLRGYHKKREQKVACIGIAPWGCIAWKEQLLGESSNVVYKSENEGETVKKTLCANHTHFLLVDDGSITRFGTEQVLRTSLDAFIASNAIPLINLLIGGGISACMNIRTNVKACRRIQIVVMKGSGGLADVLADVLSVDSEKDLDNIQEKVEEHMMLGRDVDNVDTVVIAVKEIIRQHKAQIIVFNPSEQYGLHHTILKAASAASKGPEQQQRLKRLQLAVHLDEIEVAINELQNQHADVELTNKTLFEAIKSGKSTLVQFLLKTGISLTDFVKDNLEKLYYKKLKNGEFFRELISFQEGKEEDLDLSIINEKLDNFMDEDYCSKESMTPCQELMIWAVFTGMFEMAETFWKHETSRSLENALVLFRLYRSMSKRLKNIDALKRQALSSQACTFEQRAVELLSLCYAEAPESATEIIAKKLPLWGNQSLISLAAGGMSRNFVSHICCQLYLKEIWHGKQEAKRRPRKGMMWKKGTKEVRYYDEIDRIKRRRGGCTKIARHYAEIVNFLFLVPKGKVVLHMFMYLIFLGCFVYKLLIKNEKARPGLWIYVNIFVAAATIESICEILSIRKRTVGMKARVWFHSMWKKLEVLSILIFYLGMGLTFKFDRSSRAVLALALVAWIVKFSQFYRMIHSLGPYLTMVYRMLLHMSSFLWVLLTVVVAFGIFLFSFLYSAESLSWMILFKLLFRPYLLVFGELGISNYSIGKVQTVFGTTKLDTARELIAVFGMCVYILVANVLLLNMLIAVFNNIYEDVKENSEKIWRFDRYHLIMEYSSKPSFPPPFSSLFYLFRLSCMICSKCCCQPSDVSPDKDMPLEMESLLQYSMREFLKVDDQKMPYFVEDTLKSINQKIEGNTKALIELNEKIDEKFSRIEKLLTDNHQQGATTS